MPGFAGCLAIRPAALAIPVPIYFQNTLSLDHRWNGCGPWMGCAACISVPTLLLENDDFREFIALLNSNAVRFLSGSFLTCNYPFALSALDILRDAGHDGRQR